MKKLSILIVVLGCLISIAALAQEEVTPRLTWQPLTKMPAARSNAAVVTYGKKIYVIGGNDQEGATNTFWQFNPKTKEWKSMPSMRTARFGHGAVLFNHKIYVFGGMQVVHNHTRYLRSVEVFNFWSKRWKTLHNMPYANARFGLVKWGHSVAMIGGMNSRHAALRGVELFNPYRQTWARFKSLPIPRNRESAVVLRHKLYVLGGGDLNDDALASVVVYSNDYRHWERIRSMHEARKNFGVTTLGGKIYVTGGWRNGLIGTKFLSSTEAFDPEAEVWQEVGALPSGKDGVRMASYIHRIYLFGGYNQAPSDEVEIGKVV